MIYNPSIFYDGYDEDLYDSLRRQREISDWKRLQYKKALERQRRERADEMLKRQIELERRERERKLHDEYMRRRQDEERISLLQDKERRRRYIYEKLQKEQENPILFRGPDSRLYRGNLNEHDRGLKKKPNKSSILGKTLHDKSKLSENFWSLADDDSGNIRKLWDIDTDKKQSRKSNKCMDTTPEVEIHNIGRKENERKRNVAIKSKKKDYFTPQPPANAKNRHAYRDPVIAEASFNDVDEILVNSKFHPSDGQRKKLVENGSVSSISDLVIVEDSSDDEDESLVWTKLRPSKGQWMEPVE